MRSVIVVVAVVLGILASRSLDIAPLKRQVEVTVIDLHDIPRTCYTGFPKRERTNAPAATMLGYCGALYTDLGLFGVRQSSWVPSFYPDREEIIDGLKEGCRYRIWINLIGRMPSPEALLSNHIGKRIYRAEPVGDCSTGG